MASKRWFCVMRDYGRGPREGNCYTARARAAREARALRRMGYAGVHVRSSARKRRSPGR
jgi:hypothetical protein